MELDYNDQLKRLALQKVEQFIHRLDKEKQLVEGSAIREFTALFLENQQVFHDLMDAYRKKLPSFSLNSHEGLISYTNQDDLCTVAFQDKQFSIDKESFGKLISNTIEMMREILPLGTIVELKPEYFNVEQPTSSPAKVVITGRYIAPKNYNSYFPYAGVVYPVGEIKKDAKIYFTEPLIQSVVHLGYQDEMEKAFEIVMKEEFILERDLQSIEFSSNDMKKLEKEGNFQKVGE